MCDLNLESVEVRMDVNNTASSSGDNCEKKQKYNFRRSSVIKRIRVEENQKQSKKDARTKVKTKQEAQPLSKYRRRSANARERCRINDMNLAYEQLRNVLPQMSPVYSKNKLSKQTILTLAMNYIAALRRVLGYSDPQDRSDGESNGSSCSTVSSDGESSNSSLTTSDDGLCSTSSESVSDEMMLSTSLVTQCSTSSGNILHSKSSLSGKLSSDFESDDPLDLPMDISEEEICDIVTPEVTMITSGVTDNV
ncbi:hypothetical protein LOTGIDRAFT_159843 [Lottia gigantea]|uniref:BHLH domain-containing protein n=1 Tax=Lottia gigantea TaxID=225164 RepID=V3ZY36_LOTGI|nr:hypothetical protein LOTGIDRAFT_159843 [Lottia gigantea]ESO96433.1 hypothetical protein LOTGIDRAFT_159843 [Lottia gigantea]